MRVTDYLVLVFLAIFFKKSASVCDKFALASVDALVHKERRTKAIVLRGENFNILDSYLTVDVIGSNATELCEGMVKNFPVLETLSFIYANLSVIEPGAFQNVPNLKYLSLSVNKLVNIPRGVFDPVRSLKVIYLTRNQIETIHDGAFSEMPNLKAVHLDHNKLSQLPGSIFYGSPMISLVDFSYNQLKTIDKNGFYDLKPGSSVRYLIIFLKRNQIETIDKEALQNLIPVNLHLESNAITRVSDIVSPLKEGSHVYLSNNKIECIPDDVLDLVKVTDIIVDVKNNPIHCECIERIDSTLTGDIRGELNVVTTLPCNANFPFFGNQL